MDVLTLKCPCGSVQLRVSGAPTVQFFCHCDDCRVATGGAFSPIALFPSEAIAVDGDTSTWTYKTLPRTRCTKCGTFLFGEPPGLGLRGNSGFLLSAEAFKPAFHSQCQYAVLPVKDGLPHFKALPGCFGGSDETVEW
jgi:hypothetical protein